jgi:hypothetical protein
VQVSPSGGGQVFTTYFANQGESVMRDLFVIVRRDASGIESFAAHGDGGQVTVADHAVLNRRGLRFIARRSDATRYSVQRDAFGEAMLLQRDYPDCRFRIERLDLSSQAPGLVRLHVPSS